MEDGDEEERDLEGRKSSKREEGGEPNSLTTTTTLAPSTAAPSGFNSLLHSQFDIFVKDQTRTGGFFKQSQAFKMFPVFEYRMRGDDYGEYIDPSVYMKGEYQFAMAQQAANEAAASAAEDARGGGALAKKKQMVEIPCKYTATPATLELRCRLLYIDFEGRIDGKSYKSILRQVAPKKMVIF